MTKFLAIQHPAGPSSLVPTPHGSAVITQTCDLVRPDPPYVHLSPITRLNDEDSKQAKSGRKSRFVHLPALSDGELFVDLGVVSTLEKRDLCSYVRHPGVLPSSGKTAVLDFGRRVGRRFSRFAFPDEVSPWIEPLKQVIQKQAGNDNSALGRLMDQVVEFRLERLNGGWTADARKPHLLQMRLITKEGVPPTAPDPDPALVAALAAWAEGKTPPQVAQRLEAAESTEEAACLWKELGNSIARFCKKAAVKGEDGAISDLYCEIESVDEVSYTRIVTSAEIDLDHLSAPRPLAD